MKKITVAVGNVTGTNGATVSLNADAGGLPGAVIKKGAFDKHAAAIAEARETRGMAVVAGGQTDDREGWFVPPTFAESEDPKSKLMTEEIFGPVVTAYVYPDAHDRSKWERTDRFKTERMCRDAAREQIARLPQPKKAAFKCVELQPV